jgi:hypothetical protein
MSKVNVPSIQDGLRIILLDLLKDEGLSIDKRITSMSETIVTLHSLLHSNITDEYRLPYESNS